MKRIFNADQNKAVFASVDELAAELHLSRKLTYDGLNSGTIPAIRIGKRFVIPRAAVQDWLRSAGRPAVGQQA
jgi:excisionase family DNA binding protein